MSFADPDDIPVAGDLEEQESLYLRRQKRVAVGGGRLSRLRKALRIGVFAAIVLSPLGYGGYLLANFVLTSPRFSVNSPQDIAVTGNRYVSREEVVGALGIPPMGPRAGGMNILRLSLEGKRRQVESIPWVRSATLTRSYPRSLLVTVVERTPVAFANLGGRVKLVDEEGVCLDAPEAARFDFPVLRRLEERGGVIEPRSRLATYLEFSRQLGGEPAGSGWTVSEVDLGDSDDLKALMAQGRQTIQVHFGNRDFLPRFRKLIALLPEVRKANPRIDSVDLRYDQQAVVNPKEP